MKQTQEAQSQEVNEIISSIIEEVKEELGRAASINEIEAALLKRQSEIMSRFMEHLVKHQDFSPSGANK